MNPGDALLLRMGSCTRWVKFHRYDNAKRTTIVVQNFTVYAREKFYSIKLSQCTIEQCLPQRVIDL